MKYSRIVWLFSVIIMINFIGCVSTTTQEIAPVKQVRHINSDENLVIKVRPGQKMLLTEKGNYYTAYRLNEQVEGSIMGNSCVLPPQTFINSSQSDKYLYAISSKTYFKPFAMNADYKTLSTCFCGVKFLKKDLKVIETILEYPNGKLLDYGLEGNVHPTLEEFEIINIYNPAFLRKTLKFDSFADDFLALRYMVERGTQNGYDAKGKEIAVPPEVDEQILEFDLQESKIINAKDARIEIINAESGELVFKVLQQMSID